MKFLTRPAQVVVIDKTAYIDNLSRFKVMAKELRVGKNAYEFARPDMLEQFDMLLQAAKKIEFEGFDRKTAKQLETLINVSLPAVMADITKKATNSDWYDMRDFVIKNLLPFFETFVSIENQQRLSKTTPIRIEVSRQPKVLSPGVSWQQTETGQPVVFPNFADGNSKLQTAYSKLRTSWERAGLKSLGVEDRYRLTAIASDYLPESIRLFNELSGQSSLAEQESAHMLMQQLMLLQKQIDEILAKDTESNLSAMAAHTRFLAGKVGQSDADPV